jgi:hypothetical protein
VRRGAVAVREDHLQTTKIKLKLRRTSVELTSRKKQNVSSLKDQQTKASFILAKRNMF